MTLLPLNGEANYLAHQHENRVGFLSIATTAGRSPLPRERFSPSTLSGQTAFPKPVSQQDSHFEDWIAG
ncbi:hypothetical protein VSR82_09345, partial [Burkholderia sp. JPY481]